MRPHIRNLIEQALRPADPNAIGASPEPSLRLAAEAIRLARLAASTHMILSCKMATTEAGAAEPRGDRP